MTVKLNRSLKISKFLIKFDLILSVGAVSFCKLHEVRVGSWFSDRVSDDPAADAPRLGDPRLRTISQAQEKRCHRTTEN